jgi:type IV pilus assembly protein PilM
MNIKKILRDTLTIKFDKAFGLDIGDRSVEIIELDKVFKFTLTTYGRTELPEGVVENGKIIDQNILAEKLKKLLKDVKPRKVSTNKVIISLPESQVYIQCFEVDASLKKGALSTAVIEKVTLSMPINIDKTYWDFTENTLADKTKKLIVFISVPKDIAGSYVKFCNSIGLEVVSLCIESLSLARTLLKKSDKQSLIIDIGAGSTNLSFFDSNDKINMSVTIPVAGDQMTEVIKSKFNIERAEAEALKIKFGFKDTKENEALPAILPLLKDVLNETNEAIRYYEETFKQKLDNIYIIGGTALAPGLIELVKADLKREVQIGVGNYDIDLSFLSGKTNPYPIFANVIGLGMLGASGEFKDINLIKKLPASEVNLVNKLNLFNMGYLSRVNTIRTIFNNKYVLVILVILIGLIFAVLLQQTKSFGLINVL